MSYAQYLRYKKGIKEQNLRTIRLHDDSIQKLQADSATRTIRYPEYKEAYDYVANRFPDVDVKEAIVLQCSRDKLDEVGYEGVGGFFSRIRKIIVIPDNKNFKDSGNKSIWGSIRAELDIDDILVHEMLHYVSNKTCTTAKAMQVEEEFAYGNSADYLRAKEMSDADIIRKNFMPYLQKVVIMRRNIVHDPTRSDQEEMKLFNEVIAEAYKLGQDILTIWDAKNRPSDQPTEIVPLTRNDVNLDLD